MKSPRIDQIIAQIESRIPLKSAESWDNVGCLVGETKQKFKGCVIGVDLTRALFDRAVKERANLIIIHHPPLFPKGKGVTKLALGKKDALDTLLLEAFKRNICVYVAHTNFDRCALDGMFELAHALGAEPYARVWDEPKDGKTLFKKLVTYVPIEHFEAVRDALYMVGCGHVGNYDCCGFGTMGTGNFRPLSAASPFLGKVGELEETEEVRLETLVVAGMEDVALKALRSEHPYEEIAYDLYPIEQKPAMKGMVWGLGYGFVAKLKKPMSFTAFSKKVKSTFKVKHFMTHAHAPSKVQTIAFSPGAGGSFIKSARAHKADVFITGEVGYHNSMDGFRSNLGIIELGHRESEHYFLKTMNAWFKGWKLKASVLDERTQNII